MFRLGVLLLLTLTAFAPLTLTQPLPAHAQEATPATGDTEAAARSFIEAMNAIFATGDASALESVVASDYVNHTPDPTQSGGTASPDLAGLTSSLQAVHGVFPDATVSVDDAIVEGDQAALLVSFNGMRGSDSETEGVVIVRVADGQVVESWSFVSGGTARMQPMFEATPTA